MTSRAAGARRARAVRRSAVLAVVVLALWLAVRVAAGAGAADYAAGILTGAVHPTRKCKKCKGAKFIRHRGWTHRGCFDLCPRCDGKGRELRPAARAVLFASGKKHPEFPG